MTELPEEPVFSPSDFVAVLNQTLEYAYPWVTIAGELSNFKVSRNRWVYFDLKDEAASVKFFGTVYNLPGPLEDGMLVRVTGQPRLSPLYGFSVNYQSIIPFGEGSLNKAAKLLAAKLEAEGLFDGSRKRPLPYPPNSIGLVTAKQSAAYADFVKVLNARWRGVSVTHVDSVVQGDQAVGDIVRAVERLNQLGADAPDVIVITRGGGSADDLAAFSTEQVTRAVAGSRIPTLVAIGHEVDISLAEMAADARASTPSNAAELLVPDRTHESSALLAAHKQLAYLLKANMDGQKKDLAHRSEMLHDATQRVIHGKSEQLTNLERLLKALDPNSSLKRGYAIVYKQGVVVKNTRMLNKGDKLKLRFSNGQAQATVDEVE
jgi:exodeoxyribonuclease VII large subunit